jgi:serine/threonine protein phosphatase PrpC
VDWKVKYIYVDNDYEEKDNQRAKFDMDQEVKRIYECGGEIRRLAGEDQSRIFVKGKYFPGLINTRSIGDQIGSSIGISSIPHTSQTIFNDKFNYYLLLCTDGISNVLNVENLKSIIENNEGCNFILI